MSKEQIIEALNNDELREKLLQELEVEDLEDRVAPRWPWMCFRPAIP